jgi:hypothetical protein
MRKVSGKNFALECKRAALEGQIASLRAEFAADEATSARIFSQDKHREASVAFDRVAMGRSRQHEAVKGNGSPARRNATGGNQS